MDYAVIDGEVKIIDEFTGRILEGRRWSEGLHQAVEAKEGVAIQEENQTRRDDHLPELLPHVRQARRHDRHGPHRGDRVHEDLQAPGGRDPDQPADGPRGPATTRSTRPRTASGRRSRARSQARHEKGQPVLVGTISVEVSELLSDAPEEGRHQAHGAEREARARRARGRDDRRGRAPGRGHDRDQHGRPRRGHQARRQRRAPDPRWSCASSASSPDDELRQETWDEVFPSIEEQVEADAREGQGGGRPVHPRHRAPRVAPDRQPAARPLRPPGRPGRVALLPLRRGRPRAPVRGRPHLPHPRPPRPAWTRTGDEQPIEAEDALASRSRTPRRRSRSRTS